MSVVGLDDAVLVAGAGGFIGGHLVRELRRRGHTNIRAVDAKPLGMWHQLDEALDNRQADSSTPLATGMAATYEWVKAQLVKSGS